MEKINMPKISEEKIGESHSKFVIEPLFPGYGTTVGNSLRRVLLSSITGAAATSFKIEGATHEFTTVPHVKEDMIEIMMNLKSVHFKSFSDEPVVLEISKKGPAQVTAKDFKANSNVEIVNPEAYIATLDKNADFYLEVTVEKERGFRAVNVGTGEKSEIGRIAIDAMFSPVERVSIQIEDTRVGQMTNYDKLTLEIMTNGTITPDEALKQASSILVDQYNTIISGGIEETPEENIEDGEIAGDETPEVEAADGQVDSKTKIEEMNFSQRTANALINSGIKTLGGLRRLSDLKLEEIKGLGKKGIEEIKLVLE